MFSVVSGPQDRKRVKNYHNSTAWHIVEHCAVKIKVAAQGVPSYFPANRGFSFDLEIFHALV